MRDNVQSLETKGRLGDVRGNVALTIDKFAGIRGDLVRIDDDWQNWDFVKLCDALASWIRRNPVESSEDHREETLHSKRDQIARRRFTTQQTRACVYCDDPTHRGLECHRVTSFDERRNILATKKLCFNCTGPKHPAIECNSKISCRHCAEKHHTSICDRQQAREPGMTTSQVGNSAVLHPVVIVKVAGYKFRALLDSGASHSYASSTFLNLTKAERKASGVRQIATLVGVATRIMQEYKVSMQSVTDEFSLDVNVTKVDKRELLSLENPKYKEVLAKHPHLRGVYIDDDDDKSVLPVHLILGANDFARIRTGERLRVGRRGDPVAEFTRFGWTLMSPGAETDLSPVYLAANSAADYERLCALDVLGLADSPTGDQEDVYSEFKEQLTRSSDGRYETALPWKGDHPPLPNNQNDSLLRLNSLLRKLRRTDMLAQYDAVIREQLEEGVVERAPSEAMGKEFYLPHRAVVRENAETTKLRVVYDASAHAHNDAPSLNDCLHNGPPLLNQLLSVLTRNRFHSVAVTGDIRKALLQIRIRQAERDSLQFHWIKDVHSSEVEILRFTRVVFGLAASPFLLNGVIQQHLELWRPRLPESVSEALKSLYVDDFISGGPTVTDALKLKRETAEVFADARFELHKWHSNVLDLETNSGDDETTFAKQQLENKLNWGKSSLRTADAFPVVASTKTSRIPRKAKRLFWGEFSV